MNKNIETYDLFLRFTKKQLSPNELADFELQLKNDASFKQEFDDYELSRKFMLNEELMEVKSLISEVGVAQSSTSTIKYWAGGLLLLATVSGSIYFSKTKTKEPSTSIIESVKTSTTKKAFTEEVIIAVEDKDPINKKLSPKKEETIIVATIPKTETITYAVTGHTELTIVENIDSAKNILIKEPELKTLPAIQEKGCPELSIQIRIRPSCKDEATGEIKISQVKNAEKPINYAIGEENFSNNSTFGYLESGRYLIKIKDNKGCTAEKQVSIDETYCIEKHYEISYSYNSYWTIPIQENGKVEIFNRAGIEVAEFQLSEFDDTTWKGLSKEGENLRPGLYSFIIITESKETFTGNILVLE